jgi:hypothetical protein
MALMDHSSRSKSQNKDGGGLPSWQIKTTGAMHYLPTACQVHRDHRNTKRTIQLRLCKWDIVLDRTWRLYCPLCGCQQDISSGKLPTAISGLGLQEAMHTLWGEMEPRTYVHGEGAPIDGVYHTPDIKIIAIMQLLFHEGVVDHCTTILDISARSAIRKYKQWVVVPHARRLTNKSGASVREYIKHATEQCRHHRIQERFDLITTKLKSEPITPDYPKDMETLDAPKIESQTGGKLGCRRSKSQNFHLAHQYMTWIFGAGLMST